MPRIRNLVDYGQEQRRPYETLVDIPQRDSIERLTVHVEPDHYVQVVRTPEGWTVFTNLSVSHRDEPVEQEQKGLTTPLGDKIRQVQVEKNSKVK